MDFANLTPEELNEFLSIVKTIKESGPIVWNILPENVVNLIVLSGNYAVQENAGYYDIYAKSR